MEKLSDLMPGPTPKIHVQAENPFRTPQTVSVASAPSASGSYFFTGKLDSLQVTNSRTVMLEIRGLQAIATEEQQPPLKQRKFKSARLVGEYEKTWKKEKEPRKILDKIIFFGFTIAGLGIGAYVCYDGWRSVPHANYCEIFYDFSNGMNEDHWNHEVELGGFGMGTFDWTTKFINDGYTLNLTKTKDGDGTCTNTKKIPGRDCSVRSNVTSGAIIKPVQSARLTTQGKHNLTYGKIEVVAKLPKGDWLWPAVWMMPKQNSYGDWPASGEIDIMESRGNNGDNYAGGRDEISGTLHWGPTFTLDLFWKTTGKRDLRRTDYSKDFHVFGMEWTDKYIYTYVDSPLAQTVFVKFSTKLGNMWKRGGFANMFVNGSALTDPWSQTGRPNTPVDESFYLILNVAVGSTAGDRQGDKPWINFSPTAMRDFWNARNTWMPTWGKGNDHGMTVKSVKMWREGKC